jgi:Na+/proline symporter
MRFGKISLAAIAAASLVSAPVMAQSLSPSVKAVGASKVKRVGANAKEESKLGGGSGVIIAVLAAAAVVGGIVIAAGNDDNSPTSP